MFQFFEQLKEQEPLLQLSDAQELAIWFHDSVYVVGAPHHANEMYSGMLMEALIGPFIKTDKQLQDMVTAKLIIDKTADHLTTECRAVEEAKLVLDLDLCNFAFSEKGFRATADAVEKEFTMIYKPKEYRDGRKKFLKDMLDRGFIYRTDEFRRHYEQRAKDNILSVI